MVPTSGYYGRAFRKRPMWCYKRTVEETVVLAKVRRPGINVQVSVAQNQFIANPLALGVAWA
jgi:hypothetical protein